MKHRPMIFASLLLLVLLPVQAQVINRGALPPGQPSVTGTGPSRAPNPYYERAQRYARERDWERAVRELRRALDREPDYFDAVVLLALVYREMGDYDDALQTYERALRVRRDYTEARVLMGEIYLERGDLLKALNQYLILRDVGSPRASELWGRIESYVRARS